MTESERLHGINFVYFTRIRIMMSLRLLLCACQPLITFVQTGGFYVKLHKCIMPFKAFPHCYSLFPASIIMTTIRMSEITHPRKVREFSQSDFHSLKNVVMVFWVYYVVHCCRWLLDFG
jgi:hypothetical protein